MKKKLLMILSFAGLTMTIVPSFLVFFQKMPLDQNKMLMALGTVIWFVTAPLWMKKNVS